MLEWLKVKNFAVAREIETTLETGLTVITGETGAGKSILLDALGAALGSRTGTHIIRHGEDKAEVQISFALSKNHPALAWLQNHSLEEDDQCFIRRIISRQSSSRAFINGNAVTISQLKALGELLIDIHGQNEHQSLLRSDQQRELLDQYAGTGAQLTQFNIEFKRYKQLKLERQATLDAASSTQDRLDYLNFLNTELEQFAPSLTDWQHIDEQQLRANHSVDIQQVISQSQELLDDSPQSANQSIVQSVSALQRMVQHEPQLKGVLELLDQASISLNEVISQLSDLSSTDKYSEQDVSQINQRYDQYLDLARKHRCTPSELESVFEQIQDELNTLNNPDVQIEGLDQAINTLSEQLNSLASKISKARHKAAKKLSQQVSAYMPGLGMENGEFAINLTATSELTAYGLENTQFEVSTNKGMPPQALKKVASGGELSRISLAIQVCLSELTTVSSLVFDEVDVGISGPTASVVGDLLRTLACSRQILCITHLPQVAAKGHQHLHVFKEHGVETSTRLELLSTKTRTEEIARMVGGETLTPESLANAQSLLSTT